MKRLIPWIQSGTSKRFLPRDFILVLGSLLAIAALGLALTCGCTSTRQTEDMLKEAGFKAQPASTEQQQVHLKTLPAHQISSVRRNGTQYYVYPDVTHNVLYVGQDADYQRYLKLRQESVPTTPAAQMEVDYAVWGDW